MRKRTYKSYSRCEFFEEAGMVFLLLKKYLKCVLAGIILCACHYVSAEEFCEPCCGNEPACWQGIYLGGQLGMGWNREPAKFANPNYFNTLGPALLGSKFRFQSEGFVGGGDLGYNYQCGCFVAGVEAAALGTQLKRSRRSPYFPDTDTFTSHLHWIASAKARFGFAYDQLLTFVTGGWAGGDVKLKFRDSAANIVASSNKWVNGWTVGAGAEYKVLDCFSLGVTYDYVQLQYKHKSVSCSHCGTGIGLGAPAVNNRLHIQTLLFRVNYFFY